MEKKEVMKILKDFYDKSALFSVRTALDTVIPELAEPEDERTRKAIINVFASHKEYENFFGVSVEDILAWLEKQGNSAKECLNLPHFTFDDVLALQCCMETVKKVQEDKELYEQLQSLHNRLHDAYWLEKQGQTFTKKDVDDAYLKGVCDTKQKLEKQGEQHPKFRIDDWVVDNYWHDVKKVSEITEDGYRFNNGDSASFEHANEYIRLWTIQDAKDGDVLVCESGERTFECLFIFKLIADREVHEYCSYRTIDKHFSLKNSFLGYVDNVYHPATKEQRDQLEKAMADAGYIFDFERKELKEIEQKSADNIESSAFKNKLLELFQKFRYIKEGVPTNGDIIDYVDAHIHELIDTMQKPAEWSEEEKKRIDRIINVLDWAEDKGRISYSDWEDYVTYVRCLRPQPNIKWYKLDDNMQKKIINYFECQREIEPTRKDILNTWIDWLKSLRPQNRWKPSEEQMEVLNEILNFAANHESFHWNDYIFGTLNKLIRQLKRLREE